MITAYQLAAGLRAFAAALEADHPASQPSNPQTVQLQQPTNDIMAVQQPITQAPPTVTQDQLMGLIKPHVGNDTIKTALGVAMRGMGIGSLPEAQPHQFGAMYAAFQQVLAAHGIGGVAQVQQAAPTSII